ERTDILEEMYLEDWSETPGWRTIPKKVRLEFQAEKLSQEANSEIYDSALMLYLKDKLRAVSNSYLITELAKIGLEVAEIIGDPIKLFPCPCCGSRTLDELASFAICRVCWWEDDGQDNHNADVVMGGPNYGFSLAQARHNY
ncbi:MAG: CPCC family cysteine-rich protein, partial [Saprospiraceae bacterium]